MADVAVTGQVLAEESLERYQRPLSTREARVELLFALAFAAGCAGLWAVAPPGDLRLVPAVLATLGAALAYRVRFDVGWGYSPATPLAFVVLWTSVPPAVLPLLMLVATVASVPLTAESRANWRREVLHAPGNHMFTFGAAVALTVLPSTAGLVALLAAFVAQVVADFLAALVRLRLRGERVEVREELRISAPVYGIDGALAATALPVALLAVTQPWAPLASLPLLALLLFFARERRGRLEHLLELNRAYKGVALVLGDVVEADDGYTGEHSKDVLELALEVGRRVRLPRDRMRDLEFGALLHDVGKITIPKQILHKPGRLSSDEFAVMQTHAAAGQELLDRVGGVLARVGTIVRHHHERWDGGGYPDRLAGTAIPLEARIIAACDTWNAMRTDRVYRPALSFDEAVAEIVDCSGSQFDPAVATALLDVVAPARAAGPPPQLLAAA